MALDAETVRESALERAARAEQRAKGARSAREHAGEDLAESRDRDATRRRPEAQVQNRAAKLQDAAADIQRRHADEHS